MTSYKRCRPLLGTYVEIALRGRPLRSLEALGEEAFRAIERVASEMSFHDPRSDLSRLNRARVGRWVEAGPALCDVLGLALELQERSGGIFNVAVADPLVERALLPGRKRATRWPALAEQGFEVQQGRARRLLPVRIDLGGIAKGYAVDRAVERLIELAGDSVEGVVNAGGDLRAFGAAAQPVVIRSGGEDVPMLHSLEISGAAVATSSIRAAGPAGHVDIRGRKLLSRPKTAAVSAPSCALADALTKVVLLCPREKARRILAGYGAKGSLLA